MTGLLARAATVSVAAAVLALAPLPTAGSTAGSVPDATPHTTTRTRSSAVAADARGLAVGVPRVALAAEVAVVAGRLRTPVLVNAGAVLGRAVVHGAVEPCTAALRPGVVTWLDCAVPDRGGVSVVVRLEDGSVTTRVVRR